MYEIIIIPGTRLRKTSACFIQWRDIDIGRCTSIFFLRLVHFSFFLYRGRMGT